MKRFRNLNERISLALYESAIGRFDQDAANAFRKHPYSWLLLMIPVAGVAGFFGVVIEETMDRRIRELDERQAKRDENEKGQP